MYIPSIALNVGSLACQMIVYGVGVRIVNVRLKRKSR